MVTSVRVKPRAVCTVSIVPTAARSASSAIDAENWAESATMLMPQHRCTPARAAAGLAPKRKPMVAAQVPETAMAAIVIVVRPRRSASSPAATRADAAGGDRREGRELGGRRRASRAAASRRSSPRGTRRSTPTSRTAPTCGRGSRGWPGAAGTSRHAVSTARGSNGGDGARFGPSPARPISAAARSAVHGGDRDGHLPCRSRRTH